MSSLLNRGDHIIVQSPCYQSLTEVAEGKFPSTSCDLIGMCGCDVTRWEMRPENGRWELDINFLKDSIKPNTKLVVINSPHNPTGHQISKEMFEEIINLCRQHGLYLFSDEVYRFLEHDAKDRFDDSNSFSSVKASGCMRSVRQCFLIGSNVQIFRYASQSAQLMH